MPEARLLRRRRGEEPAHLPGHGGHRGPLLCPRGPALPDVRDGPQGGFPDLRAVRDSLLRRLPGALPSRPRSAGQAHAGEAARRRPAAGISVRGARGDPVAVLPQLQGTRLRPVHRGAASPGPRRPVHQRHVQGSKGECAGKGVFHQKLMFSFLIIIK